MSEQPTDVGINSLEYWMLNSREYFGNCTVLVEVQTEVLDR
jgi:hypothetical protein